MFDQLMTALKHCLRVRNTEEPDDPELEDELDTNTFKLMDNLINGYAACAAEARECIQKAMGR